MRIAERTSLFLLALLMSSFCQAQVKVQKDALVIKLDNSMGMKEHLARTAEMREFLWSHWAKHREASLYFTNVSKEGQGIQSEFRIVILASGTRVLRVTSEREEHWISGVRIPKSEGGYEAYILERVSSKNPHGIGAEANVTLLPLDAVAPPTDYWLRIKDLNGKTGYF